MNIMPQPKPINILLVEDNPADAEMARITLEESGLDYALQIAEDGEEALSILNHENSFEHAAIPDLILLDINLPKLSGKEVLHTIRNNDQLKNITVLVLTSSHAKNDISDFKNLKADFYLNKPLDIEQFKLALSHNIS